MGQNECINRVKNLTSRSGTVTYKRCSSSWSEAVESLVGVYKLYSSNSLEATCCTTVDAHDIGSLQYASGLAYFISGARRIANRLIRVSEQSLLSKI